MIGWIKRKLRGADRHDAELVGRLVAGSLNMISGRRSPLLESLLDKDPDRAFELAVKSVAKGIGVKVDATEVRLAVAAIMLERVHQQRVAEDARHLDAMIKLESGG